MIIKKFSLLIVYFIVILISELLIKFQFYIYSSILLTLLILTYSIILIKNKYQKKLNLQEFLSLKQFFTSLLILPVIILIQLIFPFKDYFYNLYMIYGILGITTSLYIINSRIPFSNIFHNFKKYKYIILGFPLILIISYLNFKYISYTIFTLDLYSVILLALISFTTILYFYGIIQNMMHKSFTSRTTMLFTTLILTILSLQSTYLVIMSTFLTSLVLSFIYSRSKNLYMILILYIILSILQYVVFPIYLKTIA